MFFENIADCSRLDFCALECVAEYPRHRACFRQYED